MKRRFKGMVKKVLSWGAPLLWRARRAPGLLVLTYHRVLPTNHPGRRAEQPGMYVSPETLAMHIQLLKKYFVLTHLDDWLDAVRRNATLPRRACALTFDDGWKDNYTYALSVLKSNQAPATVYLVSDFVGGRYAFWPNQLARLVSQPIAAGVWQTLAPWLRDLITASASRSRLPLEGLDAESVDQIIGACKSARTDKEMLAALASVKVPAPEETADAGSLMTWNEIQEMAGTGLIRFGSHSRHHTRLSPELPMTELRDEIQGSWQVINQKLPEAPRTFCFPNGNCFPAAIDLVRTSYLGAVTTVHGWNRRRTDPYQLMRVGMHDDAANTPTAFLARLARFG